MEQDVLITPASSAYRAYQGGFFTTLIAPDQSVGALALMDMVLPRGAEPPLHVHEFEDEAFYLLEGHMRFQVGDDVTELKAGQAIYAPRKIPHLFSILSEQAHFITLITPGKFWNYFMEFSTAASEQPPVTPPQGPPPAELLSLLTSRLETAYGITLYSK
ncbi:cupin domain-containing protein [Mucilaginibacter auburnensis]|uniref:Cupin domain-containing protein n=1 Tax=Mucilaginibacter auburnensis TaxID=1457233 RepID=A0A2H9VRZ9_9SPHI|nr:cupin domain-containing protein [Mucilaginibacter auburnensis]PJJ83607.1 Cupin domain-containing protein [Mucilaginibacter auburnensis]